MDRIEVLIAILLLSFITVNGKGHTLNTSEVLQDNELLTSTNGRFQLGFFNATNSKMQYLGIWNTDPRKTVVWVANGNHPIVNGTGKLSLSSDGTLFLRDTTGRDIWSTGSQLSRVEPQACLLDIGLLVINDTKTGKLLWQSLYQLSDTLLPYVPLGYMKLLDSMLEFQLTSWNITGIDPSSGQYVRKLDPCRRYELVVFRRSDVIYRSGPWNGTRWNGFPKMTQDSVTFFLTKLGDNGALYWYEPLDVSVPWRYVMNSNGTTYRYYLNGSDWIEFWKVPDESIPSYALCGPYGIYIDGNCKCCEESLFHPRNEKDWNKRIFSGGCIRDDPLNDTHPEFVTLTNVKLPDTINAISDERKSKSECASWCQKNSSCMAYAYIGWQGCLVWFGDIIDMQKFLNAGDDLHIRVASNSESNKKNVSVPMLISSAAVLVLLAVVIILVWKLRRTPQIDMIISWITTRWPFRRTPQIDMIISWITTRWPFGRTPQTANGQEVQIFEIFDFERIVAATDDFSDINIIGRGHGAVYKGILKNGEEIAVKRAPRNAHNGNEQLQNELNLLARLKHKNLVKLMGFCIQQQEIILCFQFMHNHSLDQLLFENCDGTRILEEETEEEIELNWEQRSRLIQGISSGLLYLHEDNGDTIIHRDVKPANILLDRNMVPKISDFGISRPFEEDRPFFTTDTFRGTMGYMAPELEKGMLSPKADVYSFGIVILEIISGRRNTSCPLGLLSLVLQYLNEGRILEFKHARLGEPCFDGEIKRSIYIALHCLLEDPNSRPDMRQIKLWLTSESTHPLPLPVRASHWGSIGIDATTVVNSATLLET